MNALQNLFASNTFIPHGHCYLWKPSLVGLHVTSDLLITIAYFSIPLTLIYLVQKRRDIPFDWIFFLFGSFIVLCGTGHLLEIWTLWHPIYWFTGLEKALTAVVSVATSILLIALLPKLLSIPSWAEWETANQNLAIEVQERQQAQAALQTVNEELEQRVSDRTQELKNTIDQLQAEILERQRTELEAQSQAQQLEDMLRQLQRTQSQLIQAEKMSGLGQLVAGVAHEINNPVNFIYGNLKPASHYAHGLLDVVTLYQQHYPEPAPAIQAALDHLELDFVKEDLPKLLSSIQVGAERIRQIVQSLRNFSRLDEADFKAVNLHEGLDSTLLILQHRLKARIDRPAIAIVKEYGDLPLVECYAGQLNQVFMNLLNNAIDALEDVLDTQPNFKPEIKLVTEVSDRWVRVRVIDNGFGIPQDIKPRLFDPFFTTKPVGAGTGLGLSISYQIVVEKHKGQLKCLSTPGDGAEFIVKIPIQQTKQLMTQRSSRLRISHRLTPVPTHV